MDYKYIKWLVEEMGEMKNGLLTNANPFKKYSYKVSHKYKYIINKDINNMLIVGIIYLIDQS